MMKKIASDELRLPLVPMSETNRERLRKVLEDYGLVPAATRRGVAA